MSSKRKFNLYSNRADKLQKPVHLFALQYSQQCSQNNMVDTEFIIRVVAGALATPTTAEQSPYHSSLFPIKMSAKSQESHGAKSLAGLDHSQSLVRGEA